MHGSSYANVSGVNNPFIPRAQHTPDPTPSPLHRNPPTVLTTATSSHANPVDNDLLPLNDGSHQSIPSPTSSTSEPAMESVSAATVGTHHDSNTIVFGDLE